MQLKGGAGFEVIGQSHFKVKSCHDDGPVHSIKATLRSIPGPPSKVWGGGGGLINYTPVEKGHGCHLVLQQWSV